MQVKAILFDTRSIQKYIFSGSKLKTNIGASYIVEKLFSEVLVGKVLNTKFKNAINTEWQDNKEIQMVGNSELKCEVAYIGGGNALVLFNLMVDDVEIKSVVSDFTKLVLTEYPGLRTGAAIGKLTIGENDTAFQNSLDVMYGQLKHNQNVVAPQVNIPYTGLTVPCSFNGETAQLVDRDDLCGSGKGRFVSAEIIAKLKAGKAANDSLQEKFKHILDNKAYNFEFPQVLERLGQIETENYIAVVHIDGNNMGVKFGNCANLQARKELSLEVAKKSSDSFAELLKTIVAEYGDYQDSKEFAFNADDEKNFLPIRPLILGGDDVTFICMGRMAVEYAKRYIEFMDKKDIDCCGGIAILPTSYPFSRGYELAEQLCGAAKLKSRAEKESYKKKMNDDKADKKSCWLDFAILHGEQAPELSQIRQREYKAKSGNMHFGPYKVCEPNYRYAVEKLLEGTVKMQKLPRNKVKELRFVLGRDEHEMQSFVEQLNKQGHKLPQVKGLEDYEKTLWHGNAENQKRTPYIDMIEMIDFTHIPTDRGAE